MKKIKVKSYDLKLMFIRRLPDIIHELVLLIAFGVFVYFAVFSMADALVTKLPEFCAGYNAKSAKLEMPQFLPLNLQLEAAPDGS